MPKTGGKPTEEIISVQILFFEFRWLVPLGRSHQTEYQTLEVPCTPKFLSHLLIFAIRPKGARQKP